MSHPRGGDSDVERGQNAGGDTFRIRPEIGGTRVRSPAGIRDAYPEMLAGIDVGKEKKRASEVQFASQASPELLNLSHRSDGSLLQTAEKRLSTGDLKTAQDLAQQALQEHRGDQGRALFIMAQVA